MIQIRMNGIRLSQGMSQIQQYVDAGNPGSPLPVYQTLATDKINITSLALETRGSGTAICCCLDNGSAPAPQAISGVRYGGNPLFSHLEKISKVVTVSVYPHHSSLNTLGFLVQLLGTQKIMFQHMVTSHAMISFAIDPSDQERVLNLLEHEFDLPPTHAPFQQNFDASAFVKERYYETRATYSEQKIKTYGIRLDQNLDLFEFHASQAQVETCGQGIRFLEKVGKKFYFASAITHFRDQNTCHLFCLTQALEFPDRNSFPSQFKADTGVDICQMKPVDLISFHGPHFGDRFGIFMGAMACLNTVSITVLLAGCTGSSICLVLPASQGEKAISALSKGFDIP